MELFVASTALLIGLVIGATVNWLFCRSRIERAVERAKTDSESDRAMLNERLQNRELALADTKSQLQQKEAEVRQQQATFTSLSTRLAQYDTALKKEREQHEQQMALLKNAEHKLSDAFKALASDAL